MDEKIGKTPVSSEPRTDDHLEQKKKEALEAFLFQAVRFVGLDNDINELVRDLFAAIVNEVKKNPGAAFSSKADTDALLRALKTKEGTGATGADITGAIDLSDIIDLIDKLGGGNLIAEEKKFFLEIIRLIFCGC
jgi:hypothetical protein